MVLLSTAVLLIIYLPLAFGTKAEPRLEAIVFHLEVPGAVGLPKPEVTYVQIAGLGLEEVGWMGGAGCWE